MEWSHVAIVVDGTSSATNDYINFWLNGVLYNTVVSGKGGASLPTDDMRLFNESGTYCYFGRFDELRISNVARYEIPEPTTLSLFGLAMFLFRRKK